METANRNFWIGIAAAFIACGTIGASAAWLVAGPVIPAGRLMAVRGKTGEEVRRILGEPSELQADDIWTYDRWPTQGWVTIYFDDQGRVNGINDEQAIPGLWGEPGGWDSDSPDAKSDST